MSTHTIHHVTAVTAKIAENRRFYTGVLGLRLVKKSVNQDDVSAYHLFYADRVGTPGTDMTFFDWPRIGPTVPGAGTIGLTSFKISSQSIDWWESRLTEVGAAPDRSETALRFADPEGQRLALEVDDGPSLSVPWTAEVPPEHAIRGILGVDIHSARPDQTRQVLTEILGFTSVDGQNFETQDLERSARVRVPDLTSPTFGRVGYGGVHHVAFRVADVEEIGTMQRRLDDAGLTNSGLVDRYYFQSLYFREPGGILFELATDGPGFATDEEAATLGERLALPPFLEGRRAEIERGLKPL